MIPLKRCGRAVFYLELAVWRDYGDTRRGSQNGFFYHFQCASFYIHQIFFAAFFHIKIKPGIPIGVFRADQGIILFYQPFLYYLTWRLAVNIYSAKIFFIDIYKIVFHNVLSFIKEILCSSAYCSAIELVY